MNATDIDEQARDAMVTRAHTARVGEARYFTCATPATDTAPSVYPAWLDGDGYVRVDADLTAADLTTADIGESMVWTEWRDANAAAEILNRKGGGYEVIELPPEAVSEPSPAFIDDTDAPVEWSQNHAYIGDDFIGALTQGWGGVKLGVWSGIDNSVQWLNIPDGETADDMLNDMRRRGVLEVIPDDADLNR